MSNWYRRSLSRSSALSEVEVVVVVARTGDPARNSPPDAAIPPAAPKPDATKLPASPKPAAVALAAGVGGGKEEEGTRRWGCISSCS